MMGFIDQKSKEKVQTNNSALDQPNLRYYLWRLMPNLVHRIHRCERCDRETTHVIESLGPDNRPHFHCWDCVERDEKRFNQKPGWRRAHRTQRYQPVRQP